MNRFMKKGILVTFIVLLSMTGLAAQDNSLQVLPKPTHGVQNNSFLKLSGVTPVFIDSKSGINTAYVAEVLNETGIQSKFTDKESKAKLVFKITSDKLSSGSYSIEVKTKASKNILTSYASDREGLLNALQTVRQLAKKSGNEVTIQGCSIKDAPVFQWRAFMLDESRHFHGKQVVKNLLNEMARLKMNVFHWHLVDDPGWRIEIKKYPLLTQIGSKRDYSNMNVSPASWDSLGFGNKFYTQDEIREIVKYADDRGIRIIPEIEFPGHASASILAYPWIGTSSRKENKAVNGDLYNVTDEKMEGFYQDILDEVMSLFPSRIIHIGGDEANYAHWENSEEVKSFMIKNNIPTCSDLQIWAVNRMSRYLSSKGCKMIGWNEITGDNVRNEAHVKASVSEKLASGTIVQFWDGDISLVNKAIEKGYDVVNSNRIFTYMDYPYDGISFEKAYSFNPIPDGLSEADRSKIVGSGCQMWGEFTPNTDRLYYQTFPRIAAYAECGWCDPFTKNYDDFKSRFLQVIEPIWKSKGYIKNQPY